MSMGKQPEQPGSAGASRVKGDARGMSEKYRYEVRCTFEGREGYRVGWTDDPTGGSLVRGVRLHPSMSDPVVVDTQAPPERRQKDSGADIPPDADSANIATSGTCDGHSEGHAMSEHDNAAGGRGPGRKDAQGRATFGVAR